MKYILINDISNFYKKNKWIISVSIFIYICFALYIKKIVLDNEKVLFYIGMYFKKDYFVFIFFLIFNYVLNIYFASKTYIDSFYLGYDNIFTRLNFNKFNLCKVISISVITFIIKLVSLLIFYLIFEFNINYMYIIFMSIVINITLSICILYCYAYRSVLSIINCITYIGLIIYLTMDYKRYNIITDIILLLLLIYNILLFIDKKYNKIKLKIGE